MCPRHFCTSILSRPKSSGGKFDCKIVRRSIIYAFLETCIFFFVPLSIYQTKCLVKAWRDPIMFAGIRKKRDWGDFLEYLPTKFYLAPQTARNLAGGQNSGRRPDFWPPARFLAAARLRLAADNHRPSSTR